jgi:hypothetical protein
MKRLYLVLTAVAFVLTYIIIFQWLSIPGDELLRQLSATFTSPVGLLFVADLLISVVGFWIFAYVEGRSIGMRLWWIVIVATLTVGLCFAIPIYLYFRELHLEQTARDS